MSIVIFFGKIIGRNFMKKIIGKSKGYNYL